MGPASEGDSGENQKGFTRHTADLASQKSSNIIREYPTDSATVLMIERQS